METIKIELLNPHTTELLKNLADLKLIKIKDNTKAGKDFNALLEKLRNNAVNAPSIEEIKDEVESVRTRRNG